LYVRHRTQMGYAMRASVSIGHFGLGDPEHDSLLETGYPRASGWGRMRPLNRRKFFVRSFRRKAVTGCLQLTAWKWTLDFVLRLVNGAD